MANGGQWEAKSLPIRPGMYINFENAALANITGGALGIVGLPVFSYTGGTAVAGKFYKVGSEAVAIELVGSDGAKSVVRVLQGGAAEVLVYAVPEVVEPATASQQFETIRGEFEAREFTVFVYPTDVDTLEQTATKSWVARNREEGKHFLYVAGGDTLADADISIGNAQSVLLSDEYIVNLVNGVVLPDGTEVSSAEYAPYIAGLIAGTPVNKAITYSELPVADVTKRLKNSEINTALTSGSLVLVKVGDKVRIEQGVTTDSDATERGKIRKARARQAIATDIPATARDRYIGKVDNNPAGQASLISAVKLYLETMENNNVLIDPYVALDASNPSVDDKVFLDIAYTEVDSMERIFLTITV